MALIQGSMDGVKGNLHSTYHFLRIIHCQLLIVNTAHKEISKLNVNVNEYEREDIVAEWLRRWT